MLEQRDRRRSQNRDGSSEGNGRVRREDNLGKRKGGKEMRETEEIISLGSRRWGSDVPDSPGPSHSGTKSEASLPTRPQDVRYYPTTPKSLLWPRTGPRKHLDTCCPGPDLPQHLLATFSTSCPPARLLRGCTVMTTPSVSQSWVEAPGGPAASSTSGWMPSRPCSSAISRS